MSNIRSNSFQMTLLPAAENETEQSNYMSSFDNCFPFGTNSSFLPLNTYQNSFQTKSETLVMPENLFLNDPKIPLNSFSNKDLSTSGTASKKRANSKSVSYNRKKSKMKHNSIPEKEQNLEIDLFAIVGPLRQDQKLDSDSSRDTIIVDDTNNADPFQEPSSTKKLNCQNDNNLVKSSIYPNISCMSLLKNALNKDTFIMPNNSGNFVSTSKNSFLERDEKRPRKTQEAQSKVISQNDSIKITEKIPMKNSQSVYASMGLDEDLCDVKTSTVKEKLNSEIPANVSKPSFQNFCDVPIKIERDASLDIAQNKISKGVRSELPNLSANDMHISMTFEADPYDEEDDLPLSFLKDKLCVDETDSEAKLKDTGRKSAPNHVSTFIKQELIEKDEIESLKNYNSVNSKTVISGKEALVMSKNDCYFEQNREPPSSLNTNKNASTNFNLLSIKIKTEPDTIAEFSDSSSKILCSEAAHSLETSDMYVSTISETVKRKSKNQTKGQNKKSLINDAPNSDIVFNRSLFDKNLANTNLSINQNVNKADIAGVQSKISKMHTQNDVKTQILNVNLFQPVSSSSNYSQMQNVSAQNSLERNDPKSAIKRNEEITFKSYKAVAKKKVLKRTEKRTEISNTGICCDNVKNLESAISQSNLTTKSNSANLAAKSSLPVTDNGTVSKRKRKEADIDDNNKNVEKSEDVIPQPSLNTESLEISNTNLASDCNVPIIDNKMASKKRGKKKKVVNKSGDFDENLPITLLIKRQKSADTNPQSSESFLCTMVAESNKNISPNKKNYDNIQNLILDADLIPSTNSICSEENLKLTENEHSLDKGDDVSGFQNVDSTQGSPTKKKSPQKRKPTRRKKKNTLDKNKQKQILTDNEPFSNLQSDVQISKTCESSSRETTFNSNSETSETVKEKNPNTLIYMSFEEQPSNKDETSEEYLNTILSIKKEADDFLSDSSAQTSNALITASSVIKNIKKEPDFTADLSSKEFEQSETITNVEHNESTTCISLISEVSSELSSSTSNLNFKDVNNQHIDDSVQVSTKTKSNSPTKRKKRARRSNGWYKKKKSRTKVQDPSVLKTDSIPPVSEMNTTITSVTNVVPVLDINTDLSTVSKETVVLVRNTPVDNEKLISNDMEENQESIKEVQDTVPVPAKRKNKKKAGRSRKRKKASTFNKSLPKKLIFETPDSNKSVLVNPENTIDSAVNFSTVSSEAAVISLPPISTDSGSLIYRSANKDTSTVLFGGLSQNKNNEIITVEDSPVKSFSTTTSSDFAKKKLPFPTLSIATIQKDIEHLEDTVSLIVAAKQRNYCAVEKSKLNYKGISGNLSSEIEIIEECLKNSAVPSSSINNNSKSTALSNAGNLSNVSTNRSSLLFSKSSTTNSSSLKVTPVEPCNSNLHVPVAEIKIENENNPLKSISLLDPNDILSKNKFASDKMQDNDNSLLSKNLAMVKKEMSNSYSHNNFRNSLFSFNSIYNSSSVLNNPLTQNASMAVSNTDNSHSSESDILKRAGCYQANTSGSSDEIASNIKKEISHNAKSRMSEYTSVNAIRNQDDLINTSILSNLSSKISSPALPVFSPEQSSLVGQRTSSESLLDDEIQVLEVGAKDVPCVDLTDDNTPSLISEQEIQSHIKCTNVGNEHDNTKNNQLTAAVTDTLRKESISMLNDNQDVLMSGRNSELSASDRDKAKSQLNQQSEDFMSSIMDEDVSSVTGIETINPLVKEKYRNEFLQYPFPPSATFHYKPRIKNKTYTRINSQSLNLSIETIKSRLKNSDNITYQFGNKLGDVVKLEKYPVSSTEVECYHRILGVAPSQKLLSKCKSDIKSNIILTKEFNLCVEFQESDKTNKFESQPNSAKCNLHDIIQGITDYRMMCDSGLKTSEICDRDCPSTDTRDSFESHVSSISEMNVAQKKELHMYSTTKEFEQANLHQDANSSGRNSALSCAASDFQDSAKNELSDVDFICPKNIEEPISNSLDTGETSCSNNVFSYLPLPNKEVLDSIESSSLTGNSVSADEIFDQCKTNACSELQKKPLFDESHSLPNMYEQVIPVSSPAVSSYAESNTSENLQNVANSVLNLEVPVLRKILEVATSRSSAKLNNKSHVWKSKETFDYNHTQHIPVIDMNSKHDIQHFDVRSALSVVLEDKSSSVTSQDDSKNENSDDDYMDNEPIPYESETERIKVPNLKEKDEQHEIPQYKSRWEKIMERKNLENKKKEKVNEHLLKDCFPVSTKVTSKKINISDIDAKKSTLKKPEKLRTECNVTKGQIHIKPKDAKRKQTEIKSIVKDKGKTKNVAEMDLKLKDSKKGLKVKHKRKEDKIKDDTSELFVPDKPVKKNYEKKEAESWDKTEDDNQSKRFYGNRVTNRGTFLTESTSNLKTIKIPKKKKGEMSKKMSSFRSEEFHSLIKSPDINIESRLVSPYKILNKSNSYSSFDKKNEFYKRVSSTNSYSSNSPYLPGKNKLQIKKVTDLVPHSTDFHSYQDNIQNKKNSLLRLPSTSLLPNDESMPNKNVLLLKNPISLHRNDEILHNRKIPVLSTPSIPFQPNDDGLQVMKNTLLSNPSSNSCEFLTSNSFSSDKSPPIALLQSIISSVQLNDSSMATSDLLPFSENSDFAWNNKRFSSNSLNKLADLSIQSNRSKDSLFSSTYGSDLPSTSGNFLNSVSRPLQYNYPFHNQLEPAFDSQGLNSSVLTSNSSKQVLCQTPKKGFSTCLVPHHLKSLVGHKCIETSNVRLLMLEWSVDWLVEQQINHDPPPISNSLKKVVSSYDSFEDHYNTYFPLMMLDTWHRIYVSWTHLSQHTPHWCNITSYSVKNNFVSVECQTIFNSTIHPKGVFPDEGSILMIKYGTKTKDYNIKILGYVTSVKTRRFNPITDSKLCNNFKPPKDGNFEVFQVLTLSFMGAYNSEDIDKQLPIRIHVLCNVRSTLKQNDALLFISKSPLLRSILNPVEDGLLNFALTPRNSPQDKINECVRDITKGILSPHPLPLLTIVKAVPQSDRLNIIPLLIEKMKNVYKTKVLLCVRTVRALGDIAANICLHESLKLVIVNKRGDTSLQFQKYLLDELVSSERHSTDEMTENLHSKNESIVRTKKQIFKDCDVILSLIRNCHDEFMETTFTETESVAQMCCIVDEANLCTEPETLIPILHGISKLILIGDPDYPAKVLSKTARSYDYSRSFFHRAHDLDLITE